MSKWIQKAIKNPGAFTRKAERRGMTPAQLQRKVLSNPDGFDATTVRQANLRNRMALMKCVRIFVVCAHKVYNFLQIGH